MKKSFLCLCLMALSIQDVFAIGCCNSGERPDGKRLRRQVQVRSKSYVSTSASDEGSLGDFRTNFFCQDKGKNIEAVVLDVSGKYGLFEKFSPGKKDYKFVVLQMGKRVNPFEKLSHTEFNELICNHQEAQGFMEESDARSYFSKINSVEQ